MTEPRKWVVPPEAATEKPTILVPGAHKDASGEYLEIGTNDFAKNVLDALPEGVIYRMERQVGCLEGAAGSMAFRAVTETTVRRVIDAHVRLGQWVKIKKGEEEEQVIAFRSCSKDNATLILDAASTHPRTRAMKLLVSYPVYLPGFVLAKPGWNDGGVFYDEPPALVGLVPKAEGALDVLDDLVVDFPLKDEASRQNLYAAMLTLICRPAIEGPIPFFLLMAPLERTGKGKLIDTALGMAIRGTTIPPMQLGRDEGESEKRITSQILAGTPVLHLDNVPIGELLDSASLASLATAWPLWGGRKLGKSEIVLLPNRVTVVLSANNPKATGELVKRTIPIVLSPKSDHPELRDDFEHTDCYAYALSRRSEVLAALLGIIEAGRSAKESEVRIGGFERWVQAVVRPLAAGGASMVMSNYREWCKSADDQNADFETLVERWALMYQDAQISASKIMELVEALDIFAAVLAKPTPRGKLMALAQKVLTPLTDRPVAGWIVRRNASGSNSTFNLTKSMV